MKRRGLCSLCGGLLAALALFGAAGSACAGPAVRHVAVHRAEGRFAGWPANNGMWGWGDELVVGFSEGTFRKKLFGHAIAESKPTVPRFARSTDGGETWTVEVPSLLNGDGGEAEPGDCPGGIDFLHPDFAMTLRMVSGQKGFSRFYCSADRCKTWAGPYRLPSFGRRSVSARTDYLVQDAATMTAFITAAKDNGGEGRPFAMRTVDGGKTWGFLSWVTPEPDGYAIMPSTVSLGGDSLLTAIRCKDSPALLQCGKGNSGWIEIHRSDDGGSSWSYLNEATSNMGGNPAALLRLQDGRLALIYGYREAPYGIRARISPDSGLTWGSENVLRDDGGCWDLGYPRAFERQDGTVVVVYYYNDALFEERYIGATLWNPGL